MVYVQSFTSHWSKTNSSVHSWNTNSPAVSDSKAHQHLCNSEIGRYVLWILYQRKKPGGHKFSNSLFCLWRTYQIETFIDWLNLDFFHLLNFCHTTTYTRLIWLFLDRLKHISMYCLPLLDKISFTKAWTSRQCVKT